MLLLFIQVFITVIARVNPGVLGYASNISVDAVLSLTNTNRQASGLSNLSFNSVLAESARQKAQDMFTDNYWAHNAPDGTTPWYFFKNAGYNYLYAGENLARDFGDSDSVVQAWMNSPTHRDNIMSGRYTEIGIAVVNGTLNGQETTLVVQHFGKPSVVAAAVPAQAVQAQSENIPKPTQTPQLAMSTAEPLIAVVETEERVLNESPLPVATIIAVSNTLVDTSITSSDGLKASPVLSAFDLTKSINVGLSVLVIGVLAIDGWMIYTKKTLRRSGKNFIHLSLFALVVIIIVLTKSGKII